MNNALIVIAISLGLLCLMLVAMVVSQGEIIASYRDEITELEREIRRCYQHIKDLQGGGGS